MRLNDELEETTEINNLEAIRDYVKVRLHPAKGAFVLPQTSVPACLAAKALWAAFISWSFGPETFVSNGTHAICGTVAGLLFGSNSLYGAVSGTNKLLKEISTNINKISDAMNSDALSDDVLKKLNEKIKNLPTKPQAVSWSQIVNVAFAWYTATITSFTYTGVIRDAVRSDPCIIANKPCSDTYPAFPMAVTFAVFWGACALLFAYYGQREQAFLAQVNNKLKELIAYNPELSQAINANSRAIPIGSSFVAEATRSGAPTPRNNSISNSGRTEETPLLK